MSLFHRLTITGKAPCFSRNHLSHLKRDIIQRAINLPAEPAPVQTNDPSGKIGRAPLKALGGADFLGNLPFLPHVLDKHVHQLLHELVGPVRHDERALKGFVRLQIAADLQENRRRIEKEAPIHLGQHALHLVDDLAFDFLEQPAHIRIVGIKRGTVDVGTADDIGHGDLPISFSSSSSRFASYLSKAMEWLERRDSKGF